MTAMVDPRVHMRILAARLRRQNKLIEILGKELDRARTEAETEVILELLGRARERLDGLEHQAKLAWAGSRSGFDAIFPPDPQGRMDGWFVGELSA